MVAEIDPGKGMSVEEEVSFTAAANQAVARNTLINLGGQGLVALSALALLPMVVKALGAERFGLLSIALAVFGSLTVLDLGLGRATTKFVADHIATGETHRIPAVLLASGVIQLALGVAAGAALYACTPLIASSFLKAEPKLLGETVRLLRIVAVSIPLILVSSSLRGALEGAQRFFQVNVMRVALNASNYLLPFGGVIVGLRVSTIVLLLALSRIFASIGFGVLCALSLPVGRWFARLELNDLGRVVRFGGWVAVSNMAMPILVSIDRYVIGALISVAAVTYFSVPFEVLNGLWMIPGAICAAMFPVMAGAVAGQQRSSVPSVFSSSLRLVLGLLGPVAVVVAVFARDLLGVWQGALIARESTLVLQVLLVGLVVNSVGWVPQVTVTGLGRPDLITRVHLVQVVAYPFLVYALTATWGVVGAACAFSVRVALEAGAFFILARKLVPETPALFRDRGLMVITAGLVAVTLALELGRALLSARASLMGWALACSGALAWLIWRGGFDAADRRGLILAVNIKGRRGIAAQPQ